MRQKACPRSAAGPCGGRGAGSSAVRVRSTAPYSFAGCARNMIAGGIWAMAAGAMRMSCPSRSEESRVGKECVRRVDLGVRRIITKKKMRKDALKQEQRIQTTNEIYNESVKHQW